MSAPETLFETVRTEADRVLVGNDDVLEGITISLLTGGHILLEGVPGVAKTTIARLYATITGLDFHRIQLTPDVLPADITGTRVYSEATGEFSLQRGPVFTNLLLADEINRATPKTQSALLESMQEAQVTIDGDTLDLPSPFMVIATQNPIEHEGTYALPEAQRDRFQFKLTVDLPDRADEHELLDRFRANPDLGPDSVEQAITSEELDAAREAVREVYVDEKLIEYILDIIAASRAHAAVEHGGSPRASLTLLHAGRARAAIHGRTFTTPDDIKALAHGTLVHRLVLSTDADLRRKSPSEVVTDILASVEPPEASLVAGADAQVDATPTD
ncbi:AAA family ATPase [Salinigranum halophilum]|uniref:AAA family ATPase n=1 Tax=Salinigranum halophilum TaxID=2565931 RepID=UPI0010A871AF|nr:MoxR family ATPase [Salinigranum halophilum]